jgi:hypothetical protein
MHEKVNDLWHCGDPQEWFRALECYQRLVPPKNVNLDQAMDSPDLKQRIGQLDPEGWYAFLHDEYVRWKYGAAANRLATARYWLKQNSLDQLYAIRKDILQLNGEDILKGLETAKKIKGLGTAGASGLLALLYPQKFATVDQFVVKALRKVSGLPEAHHIAKIKKPENLSTQDGVLLIKIMRRKAEENNRLFNTSDWTPRKIDKVLWAYGR